MKMQTAITYPLLFPVDVKHLQVCNEKFADINYQIFLRDCRDFLYPSGLEITNKC